VLGLIALKFKWVFIKYVNIHMAPSFPFSLGIISVPVSPIEQIHLHPICGHMIVYHTQNHVQGISFVIMDSFLVKFHPCGNCFLENIHKQVLSRLSNHQLSELKKRIHQIFVLSFIRVGCLIFFIFIFCL
jgi:hypothetical protein